MPRGVLLALAVAAVAPAAATEAVLPYSVAVEVVGGENPAPATVCEEALTGILLELRTRGCAPEVATAGAKPADLLLRVILADVEEETVAPVGVAELARPQGSAPSDAHRVLATFEIAAQIDLLAPPAEEPIRSKGLVATARGKPFLPGDDASADARAQALSKVAREARTLLCRSRANLEKRLEEARRSR